MNWGYRRLCAFVVMVLGLLLLTKGVHHAAPGTENCAQACAMQEWYVDSPDLNCFRFAEPDCAWCWQGRCQIGPWAPYCVKTETDLKVYPYGKSCSTICTLELNKWSQATIPTGTKGKEVVVKLHECSTTPP